MKARNSNEDSRFPSSSVFVLFHENVKKFVELAQYENVCVVCIWEKGKVKGRKKHNKRENDRHVYTLQVSKKRRRKRKVD